MGSINEHQYAARQFGMQLIDWAFLLLLIPSLLSCKLQTTSVNDQFKEKAVLPHDKAAFPQQELKVRFNIFKKMYYWEGKCEVSGTKNNVPVSGKSYVEITNQK